MRFSQRNLRAEPTCGDESDIYRKGTRTHRKPLSNFNRQRGPWPSFRVHHRSRLNRLVLENETAERERERGETTLTRPATWGEEQIESAKDRFVPDETNDFDFRGRYRSE